MRICVFCGAASGKNPKFATIAHETGRFLAERNIGVVFGGGNVGLMGALADGALSIHGNVIGIIPEALRERELAHSGVAEMRVTKSMHERKMLMHELSDGFIALPGGLGTFDELFESLTWMQLGYHEKPVAILNVEHYYDPLLNMLDHAVANGFIPAEQRAAILVDTTIPSLLEQILKFEKPHWKRWIQKSET
ncbi:MAG: TIGR00730 family Rossman fold protein [Planctomycetota bacterium]